MLIAQQRNLWFTQLPWLEKCSSSNQCSKHKLWHRIITRNCLMISSSWGSNGHRAVDLTSIHALSGTGIKSNTFWTSFYWSSMISGRARTSSRYTHSCTHHPLVLQVLQIRTIKWRIQNTLVHNPDKDSCWMPSENEEKSFILGFRVFGQLSERHPLWSSGCWFLQYVENMYMDTNANQCQFCSSWVGAKMEHISQPFPDYAHSSKFKYSHFSATPSKINGNARVQDDSNPRVPVL